MSKMAAHSGKLPLGPNYWTTFAFEENFNVPAPIKFHNDHEFVPFVVVIGVYLPMLYFGQKIMANRDPIKARSALILWNFALGAFSLIGFTRVFEEFQFSLRNFGFEHSICNNSWSKSRPTALWIYIFCLSKMPELVDTLFLVLRKQKLIFLHVYHHSVVCFLGWFMYTDQIAPARWFATMNFGVHSVMYTYYALKAFPNLIRIPKWVSMVITTSQILQMAVGSYVSVLIAYHKLNGQACDITTRMTIGAVVIYVSHLYLFSHFFYKAYCSPAPPRSSKDVKKRV